MKIGMLTGLWYLAEGASVQESLERVAALGFHYVDLHGVFHAGPRHLDDGERMAVKRQLETLDLLARNYVCHAPFNIPSASEEEVEASFAYLKEAVDMARLWGINQLMLNAGTWTYGVKREAAWSKSVAFLQRLCDYAAPRQVFIVQEAEPFIWFLVNDVPSTLRMAGDIGRPNFATLVDLGHLALAREGPDDLYRLGETVIHAHFSDHEPLRHTNQVIGTGFTPTSDYLEALRAMEVNSHVARYGYAELVVSFELGFPGDRIDDPDGWVLRSLEHVRRIAPYMALE